MFFLRVSETGRALLVDLTTKIKLIQDESTDSVVVNVPRQLSQLCERLTMFVRGRVCLVKSVIS